MKRLERYALVVFGAALLAGCQTVAEYRLSERDGNVGFALAPEIRERILRPPNVRRILNVSDVKYLSATYLDRETHQIKGYCLLKIEYSIEGDFGFEAISYREMCLARKPEQTSWRTATQFFVPPGVRFESLREMQPDDLEKIVNQRTQPNNSPEPTSGGVTPAASAPVAPPPSAAQL